MAWQTIDRNKPVVDGSKGPVLTQAVREKIQSFFPRYETKRAVLLPALHVVQDALGQITPAAMIEIAALLEIPPSDVLDVVGFYTHYWTKPRGDKVVIACRSITCQVMGSDAVLEAFQRELGIGEHQTTPDGKFSLATEECLAGCDFAPCVLVNERLHKRVQPEDVPKILADADCDKIDVPRSELFDAPNGSPSAAAGSGGGAGASAAE
jgi:NADH-quinone oxidoreductase subunit E